MIRKSFTWIWLLGLMVSGCGRHAGEQRLTIATAANMQFAMEELTMAFTAATDIPCELVVSSSGKLTAQIREGAPFDLMVSADMRYPEELHKAGMTVSPPQVYAYGKLVLWTLQQYPELNIQTLMQEEVRHVALANPSTAPYGKAAVEVLKHYGLYESLEEKFVYGESIAQTNQFIVSRAADAGFTALSVVRAPGTSETGHWTELEAGTYQPIAQGVVVLTGEKESLEDALAFRDFLFSETGRKVLTKYGYALNE